MEGFTWQNEQMRGSLFIRDALLPGNCHWEHWKTAHRGTSEDGVAGVLARPLAGWGLDKQPRWVTLFWGPSVVYFDAPNVAKPPRQRELPRSARPPTK